MSAESIRKVRVVGAGVMGSGIAQLIARAGVEVELADYSPEALTSAVARIRMQLDRDVSRGRSSRADAQATLARIVPLADPFTRAEVDLILEAVKEDLQVKHDVLARLEAAGGADTILATNTSSFSITSIGTALTDPARLAGLHFFNPAPLMRVVEVIPGLRTASHVVDRLSGFVERLGHRPVVAADTPGFVVNHAGRGLVTEGLQLLDEGAATPADIDRIARDTLGLRMGPFELMDLTGLDVTHPVLESIWSGFYADPRLRPSPTARLRAEGGLLGRKNGAGFYAYVDGSRQEGPEAALPPYGGQPIWTDAPSLAELLRAAGVHVAGHPEQAAALLLAPVGTSALDAALTAGLDPSTACGVDPLAGFAGRLTMAVHPGASPAAAQTGLAALAATGQSVTLVRDAPASVASRLLASIVNTAAEIAQRRIATPEDIDTAVALGLGYPRGPLAWGEAFGASRVLDTLKAMEQGTGDPRYRPSRWITERAAAGVPLTEAGTDPNDLIPAVAEATQ